MNGKIEVYLKNRELVDSTVVVMKIGVIIMQLRPKKRHLMESTIWLQT